jgi:predicted Fe-S protein YdhL (DUF1289 family)
MTESPCVKKCELDMTRRTCTGCKRTVQEIVDWSSYNDEQRKAVLIRIDDAESAEQ